MKIKIPLALLLSVSIIFTGCSIPGTENISFDNIGNVFNNTETDGNINTSSENNNKQTKTSNQSNQNDNNTEEDDISENSKNYYLRSQLNSSDQKIYDAIFKSLSSFKTDVSVDGSIDTDKLQRIIIAVTEDHPEYFWISGGCTITDKSVGFKHESEIEFDMPSGLNINQAHQMYNEVLSKVQNIIASIPQQYQDAYDIALYLHDYLVQNCTYASDYESVDDTTSRLYHSVYGCLIQGTAVCEGYAESYHLLLRECGIESGIVTGTADSGSGSEGHAWNYLKLDGSWYWADVTWDDPKSDSEGKWISHGYFLITDDILYRSHTSDSSESFYVPQCNDTTDNYFMKSGTYISQYDFSQINDMLNMYESYGYLEIEFADENTYNTAVDDLFVNKNISNADVFQGGGYSGISYTQDDESLTVRVLFE